MGVISYRVPSASADVASLESQAPVLAWLRQRLKSIRARSRVCIGRYERLQRRDQLRVSCTLGQRCVS